MTHALLQLPKLRRVYLGSNRFQPPLPPSAPLLGFSASSSSSLATFPLLQVLVLNNTRTSWAQAVALAPHLPAL